MKAYAKSNREGYNARAAKGRAKKLKAMPAWLTKDHHNEILEFYTKAKKLSMLLKDEEPLHVDHIVPLNGENVSGLHVPWNLRVVTAEENRSKGNKHSSDTYKENICPHT